MNVIKRILEKIIVASCFLSTIALYAGGPDNLLDILGEKKLSLPEKKEKLLRFVNEFNDGEATSIIRICDSAILTNKTLKEYLIFIKGSAYKHNNRLKEGIEIFKTVENSSSNSAFSNAVDYQIAWGYLVLSDYSNAVGYFQKNLSFYSQHKLKKDEITTRLYIAICYRRNNNFTDALNYISSAYEDASSIKDIDLVNECRVSYAQYYMSIKENNKADSIFTFLYKNGSGSNLTLLSNFSEVKLELKQIGAAERLIDSCYDLSVHKRDTFWIALSLIGKGNIFKEQKKYLKAIEFYEKAYAYCRSEKMTVYQKTACENLYICYLKIGEYKKSLEYHVQFVIIRDSIFNEKNMTELNRKQIQYEYQLKEARIKNDARARQLQLETKNTEERKQQKIIVTSIVTVLIIAVLFSIFLFKGLQKNKLANKVITEQKHLVEDKQKEILASIAYAKRLQQAILPPKEFIDKSLPNNFILYLPKDVVAGDFYWAEKMNDLFFVAAADSTGHGVPGALVSVVCSNALNRAINEFNITETGRILDKARELVLQTFEKSVNEVKDGMDISLLCIDPKNRNVFWSGANNPLWYVQHSELKEIKADKQPIGKTDHPKPFTTHRIDYKEDTIFYLFTDGIADQFGGPKGKKFKYKQFSELLLSASNKPLAQQHSLINQTFLDWKKDLEQVDDICIIGIKL